VIRTCLAEVESLHRQAMAERHAAVAASHKAAAERAHAEAMLDRVVREREVLEAWRRDLADAERMEGERQRRRSQRPKPGLPPVGDVPGQDLRPDPGAAQDAAGFMEALRQFRVWAGNPSFRDMERACGGRPVASTMCKVLATGELPPRFEVVAAIITACGGCDEDRQRFATAWRRLTMPECAVRAIPARLRALPGATSA
jgi:hypothetical protein